MEQPKKQGEHPAQQQVKRGRVVVAETVYHQYGDAQPTAVEKPFSYAVSSDEEPYRRTLKVTQEWQQLDTGWLDASTVARLPDMICLFHEPEVFSSKPTSEQLRQAVERVVLLRFAYEKEIVGCTSDADMELPSGRSCRLFLRLRRNLYLCCLGGECKVALTVFPR